MFAITHGTDETSSCEDPHVLLGHQPCLDLIPLAESLANQREAWCTFDLALPFLVALSAAIGARICEVGGDEAEHVFF